MNAPRATWLNRLEEVATKEWLAVLRESTAQWSSHPKVFTHAIMDDLHLIAGEHAHSPHQAHGGRGLYLLKMEGTTFLKVFIDADLLKRNTMKDQIRLWRREAMACLIASTTSSQRI
jgi:hypothetical protein